MKINNKIVFTAIVGIMNASCAVADEPAADAKEADPVQINEGFAGSYLSGRFAQSNGDVNNAIHYLHDAHDANPANQEVVSQLQATLLLDGRIDEATNLAAAQKDRKDPISALLLTIRNVKNNNLAQADASLASAFDGDNGQLWLPLVQAWLDVGQKKLTKPMTMDNFSADIGRAAPVVNYHLALINAAAGFKDAAAKNFKAAVEDPKNPPARVMEALLQFYNKNDAPEALTPLVNAYREANPKSTLDEQGAVVAGTQDGVAEVLFTMGSIMLSAEATQDAVIYLRLALDIRPDFAVASVSLGDAYAQLLELSKANEAYAQVSDKSRFYEAAQLHIAMNYNRMGKFSDAVTLLDKMNKSDPSRYETLVAKGDLLRQHEKFSDAVTAYSQALAHIPEITAVHWPLLFARGVCYERLGKWQLSEKDLEDALKLRPDQPEVLNYLGYSWLVRGVHINEARAMIEKAVKARPEDGEIIDSMGWALYLGGDYDEAASYLEKALEALPSDPTVNDHLGDVYWRQGRKTEARYQWERSLTFSPQSAEVGALRKKIKDGLPELIEHSYSPMPGNAADQHAELPIPANP